MDYKTENYKILKPLLDKLFKGVQKQGYGYGFEGILKNSDEHSRFWLCSISEEKPIYIKFIYRTLHYGVVEDIFNLNIVKDTVEVINRCLIKKNNVETINDFKKELKQNPNMNDEKLNTYLKQL